MIPFQLAFVYKITGGFRVADIICQCFLFCDIIVRANTAFTSPSKFCFDRATVLKYYLNTWLLLDAFAAFPFCYLIMLSSQATFKVAALARLPRLLKLARVFEIFQVFEYETDMRIELYRIVELFLLFGFSAHLWACLWAYVGTYESTRTNRFDG
jgi:hypothetical protein